MSKIRRIDWSPSEWLAGTRGQLTQRQLAVYDTVLNMIYDRAGPAPNDAGFIAGHFKAEREGHRGVQWLTRHTRASLDRLVEMGKLHVSTDGQWLTNGRADRTLNEARERISGAVRAGIASGRARRAATHGAPMERLWSADGAPVGKSKSSADNDLARTTVRNHQPSTIKDHESTDLTISTAAARDPAPDQTAPGRAPAKADLEALAAIARAKLMKGQP